MATSGQRVPSFSSIPTIAEAGFKDFDVSPWFGLMAPKKTPPDVILKINKDVNGLLRSKDAAKASGAQVD